MLDPSRATAKTWEQIQCAVGAFNNPGDRELRPSVTEYWFAHLGFVSQVKLFTSSFGENKSLDIFRILTCLRELTAHEYLPKVGKMPSFH